MYKRGILGQYKKEILITLKWIFLASPKSISRMDLKYFKSPM